MFIQNPKLFSIVVLSLIVVAAKDLQAQFEIVRANPADTNNQVSVEWGSNIGSSNGAIEFKDKDAVYKGIPFMTPPDLEHGRAFSGFFTVNSAIKRRESDEKIELRLKAKSNSNYQKLEVTGSKGWTIAKANNNATLFPKINQDLAPNAIYLPQQFVVNIEFEIDAEDWRDGDVSSAADVSFGGVPIFWISIFRGTDGSYEYVGYHYGALFDGTIEGENGKFTLSRTIKSIPMRRVPVDPKAHHLEVHSSAIVYNEHRWDALNLPAARSISTSGIIKVDVRLAPWISPYENDRLNEELMNSDY